MIENEPDPLRRIPIKRPAELRAEIGAELRAARLKRGVSLEAVAQQTRIPKRYLEALEADRFDEFPAFVYMRGFLKSYCDHLDVPFDELWKRLLPPEPVPEPGAAAVPAAAAPAAGAPAAPKTPPAAPRAAPTAQGGLATGPHGLDTSRAAPLSSAHPQAPSATGAIVFALALAAGLGVWMFAGHKPRDAKTAESSTPRALMPLPRAVEPKVNLRALDDSWVRVDVDGVTTYEGRLPRGAAMDWKPQKTVALRTTTPAALSLTVNGAPQPLTAPGPDGEYRFDVP